MRKETEPGAIEHFKKFKQFVELGGFYHPDFPVAGANALGPSGKGLERLVSGDFNRALYNLGGEEVGLPEALPPIFVEHLRPHELYRVILGDIEQFTLSASAEMTAAWTASKMVQRLEQLPLILHNESVVHREVRPQGLITAMEFKLWEINAFFRDNEAELDFWRRLNHQVESLFQLWDIPVIGLNLGREPDSPMVFWGLFHHLQRYGALYWSKPYADEYTSRIGFKVRDNMGCSYMVLQLNAGITSRVLAAILSNHMDDKGFILPPNLWPFDVVIPAADLNEPEGAGTIVNLADAGLRCHIIHETGDTALRQAFMASGIPVMLKKAEGGGILISPRVGRNIVFNDPDSPEIISAVLGIQAGLRQEFRPRPALKVQDLSKPLGLKDDYAADVIYRVSLDDEAALLAQGLGNLGYEPDGRVCFAKQVIK